MIILPAHQITLHVATFSYYSCRDLYLQHEGQFRRFSWRILCSRESAKSFKMPFKTLRMFSAPWPKQNTMTDASLRHPSLYLWLSSISPDREGEKRQRESGEKRRKEGAQGTWRVFRRKMAVSSCQSLSFWCHRFGTGLSVSRCSSYQRLTHNRDRRRGGNTRRSTRSPIYTWHTNFVKSVEWDEGHRLHLHLK